MIALPPFVLHSYQVIGCHNNADVGKRLGEVAQEGPIIGVYHFGEKPEVIGVPQQFVKEFTSLFYLPHEGQHPHQPEAAKGKSAFISPL